MLDLPSRCNDNRSLNGIFKLADIARPVVIDERRKRIAGNTGNKATGFFLVVFEEMKYQQLNVLDTLAKRGQRDRENR